MQFLYQPLTWGFLLVGVPILVHLINMLRHRKLKWAAMDFLLESNRRNRRWVMLKQWLLLASRILAMILLVLMLAKWVSSSQWLGLLGGQTNHHYILLDDSFSMEEVDQGESAYGRALSALGGIVRSLAGRGGEHQVTLMRYSRAALAARGSDDEARVDVAADLNALSVPRDPAQLLDRINATAPTALQLSPNEALDLIAPMIAENSEQNAEVYLLTDLRRNEYGEPETTKNKLQALADSSAKIQFIDCGKSSIANLTLATMEPEQEVWAAGVPLMVRFQVRNQSNAAARNVVVKIKAISYPQGATTPQPEQPYSGQTLDLPPVVIEQIEAGETVSRQVQVIFGSPGQHVVTASLPDDALAADNRRWCVVAIQQSQRVLLIDGEVDGSNAFFFRSAVNPGKRLQTGISIEQADATYLRDIPIDTLKDFDVVGLLDVPRLEPQAIAKLEEFCRQGRGLFIMVGRNTNLQFMNEQMFRGGEGLLPREIVAIEEYPSPANNQEPEVVATDHPVLLPLTQLTTSPFLMLQIRKHLVTSTPLSDALTEVVAYGQGHTPLILDCPFGNGRVLTVLTGLTSDWSNWAQDPTFVVLALRSLGYLGSFRRQAASEPVGSPLQMVLSGETVLPDAEVLIPTRDLHSKLRWQQTVTEDGGDGTGPLVSSIELPVSLAANDRQLIDGLLRPGVFEIWMLSSQGVHLLRNAAHNVSAAEGNLERVTRNELEKSFAGLPVEIRTADAVSGGGLSSADTSQSTLTMALLAVLLLGEQLLAYSASYHSALALGAKS